MTFPGTPLPIIAELLIDGTWTDITSDVRGGPAIQIIRGYSGEQANLSPGSAQFTINNRAGKYTNKNPTSPYYGKLGRNTQFRAGVDTGIVSARFIDSQESGGVFYDGSTITTPDKAALDIVGDIDMLIDCDADDWLRGRGHLLASKYIRTGNQRSWSFVVDAQGYPAFVWSTDGNTGATLHKARCPVPAVTSATGRISLRVQFDVNNGAGGWTASFYTAPTASGPFVLLGSVSGSGVTSIFSSSARLEIGTIDDGSNWGLVSNSSTGDADVFAGKIYVYQLRNALGSGTVALMDARAQTAGTTSWTDATSTTWTVTGTNYLSSVDWRLWHEIPSLPNRWDSTGSDIYIPTRSADILQRLTSATNSKPLESPILRNLRQYAWDGYWPGEDPSGTPVMTAYLGADATYRNADFEPTPAGFDGSAGALNFNDDAGTASGTCTATAGRPTTTTFLTYFKFDTPPATSTYVTWMNWQISGGTAAQVTFSVNNNSFLIQINDRSGGSLVNTSTGFGGIVSPSNWLAMRIKLTQDGANVDWEYAWYQINDFTLWGTSGTYAGTMGRPSRWSSPSFTGKLGLQLAHVAMGSFDFNFLDPGFVGSTNAYLLETWIRRARRLAMEQGIPFFVISPTQLGSNDTSFVHTMGPQGLKTFVSLLQECADVAGGMLFAPRDKFGVTIRGLEPSLNNKVLTLDYSAKVLSGDLQPEPDDFLIVNDVVGQLADGTTYRYAKTSGPLNINEPSTDEDGVGDYNVGPIQINVGSQAELVTAVQRMVAQGTVDAPRWPQIQAQLERAPFVASADLTAAVRKVDLGRGLALTHLPSFLPPDEADLMTVGYTETMGTFTHALNWNTRPAQGWQGGVWAASDTPAPVFSLWGARYTTLKTAVNATATSLTFAISNVLESWSTTATPYDVMISGERITVTSMAARTGTGPYQQVATVTRSVNGVVKSLAANEVVTLIGEGRWV